MKISDAAKMKSLTIDLQKRARRQLTDNEASFWVNHLDDLAQFYGRQGNSQRLARAMLTKLSNATMEDIFQHGLHEFIGSFIAENNRLGAAINEQYLT